MMARGARRPGRGFPGLRVSGLRFGKAATDGVAADETPPDGEPARPAAENGAAPNEVAPSGTPAAEPPPELQAGSVPRWLQTSAAWSWRLLLLAAALYVAARVAALLYIVVVPCR